MILGNMEEEAALPHITSKLLRDLPWARLACLQFPFLKADDTLPILFLSFCPNFFLHRSLLPDFPFFPSSASPLFCLPIPLLSKKWLSQKHCLDCFPSRRSACLLGCRGESQLLLLNRTLYMFVRMHVWHLSYVSRTVLNRGNSQLLSVCIYMCTHIHMTTCIHTHIST